MRWATHWTRWGGTRIHGRSTKGGFLQRRTNNNHVDGFESRGDPFNFTVMRQAPGDAWVDRRTVVCQSPPQAMAQSLVVHGENPSLAIHPQSTNPQSAIANPPSPCITHSIASTAWDLGWVPMPRLGSVPFPTMPCLPCPLCLWPSIPCAIHSPPTLPPPARLVSKIQRLRLAESPRAARRR